MFVLFSNFVCTTFLLKKLVTKLYIVVLNKALFTILCRYPNAFKLYFDAPKNNPAKSQI